MRQFPVRKFSVFEVKLTPWQWSKTNLFEAVAQVALHRWKGSSEVSPQQHVHFVLFSLWPHCLGTRRPAQNRASDPSTSSCIIAATTESWHPNPLPYLPCQQPCQPCATQQASMDHCVPQLVPLSLHLWVFCAQDSLRAPQCRWQNWNWVDSQARRAEDNSGASWCLWLVLRCFLPHHSLSISKGISRGKCLKISVSENRVPKNNHNSSTFYYWHPPLKWPLAIIWTFIQPLSSELPPLFPCQAS